MDDLARQRSEVHRIADHAVVETGANGQQHIAVLHRQIGLNRPVHAGHPEELRIRAGITAQAHQGIGNRKTKTARERRQLLGSVGENHPAAGINHRPLGAKQQLNRFLDLPEMPLDHRVIRTHLNLGGVLELALVGRNILRDIDQNRPGTTRIGNIKCLFHRRGEVTHILDQEVMLDTGTGNTDRIALLEGVLTDIMRRHLPGNDHHRDRIHVRRRNTCHGIGRAGARSDQCHTDALRRPCQSIGSMDRCLLMTHQNMLDFVLFEQLVVDVKNRPTRITEYVVDLFFLKAPDYNLRTSHHSHKSRLNPAKMSKKPVTL